MKISHLQEGSEAGMPSPSQPAPKFGRSDVAIEETTVAGNVGGGAPSNMGMQRRGQGSMFQGIKTSKKFANTPVTEDDISEEHISAKQRREEFFNKSQSRDIGNRPQNKDILPKQTHESDGEYDDEAGMIKTNLHTSLRAIKGLHKTIGDSENCPEWVQEKIAVASDYLVTCWDYMISQHEQGRKYEMNEVTLGSYRKKATMSKALAQMNKQFHNDPKADSTIGRRTRGLQRVASRDEITRLAQLEKDTLRHRENLPNYEKQLADLEKAYKAGGGDTWQYADRMMPNDIKLRDMHTQMQNLRRIIHNTQKDMNEGQWKDIDGASAPPKGAKLQIKTIEPGSAIRVDPNYKEPVAPKDNGMGRIVQGTWQSDPKGTVKAPSGDPEGVKEELKMKHQRDTYGPETGNGTPLNRRPDNSNSLASRDSVRAEVPNITKSADGHPTVKYNFTGKTTATRVEPTITSKSVPRLDSNKPIPNFLKTRPMPAPQLKSISSDGNFPSNKRNEPHVVPPLRIGKTDGEEDQGVAEESKGLWANIHAKRDRIKHGSGEKMRKPGSSGAPTADALRKSAK